MKMKNTLLLAMLPLTLISCQEWWKTDGSDTDTDSVQTHQVEDSTLWGRLGEDTGMSVFEFVTERGDTLYVRRTSEYSGEEAEVLGEVRNHTDRWAFLLTDNEETLGRGINYTMLQEKMTEQEGDFHLWNGLLIRETRSQAENGKEYVLADTCQIVWLDSDSLVYIDQNRMRQTIAEK